jgi:tetratricopeptide (TPR) repeat protein
MNRFTVRLNDWTPMRLIPATSALTIVLLATAAHADQGSSFAGNYLASRTAGHIRDAQAATDFLNAALSDDPQNPVLIERLFQNQLAVGNIDKAESTAKEVITFNSQQRMARVLLGLKEFRNRRYVEARGNFNEAAYTPVGELTSALLSAWAYAGEGALNPALKELDKLDTQESFANFKAMHVALITDYLGSNVRADAAYKKAYELAGTSLRVVQAYGNFLERNDQKAEAEKIYRAFLMGSQRNVLVEAALASLTTGIKPEAFITTPTAGAGEALFSLAAAMNSEQSIDVAQSYAQMALSFNPDQPVTQSLLGDILTDMKSYEAAIATFEKIPQSSPLRVYADTEIAINLQRLDKNKEAVERLNAVLTKEPKNLDAWTSLGNVHRVSGNNAAAVDAYGKAIDLLPTGGGGNWQLYYNRGISQDHLKAYDKSEADFRTAMKISGDEPSVLNYLGYSLIDRGQKLDEAIAMVKKAVDLRPNDGYIVDSLGWAYYTMGDYDQAAGFLERAVDLNPGDPIIAEHLGDAYWHVGRKNEAGFQYQHAKDNHPEPADLARIEGKLKNGLIETPKTAVKK